MQDYLLRIEAVNLDFSVYDTNDISTIRGGSFMLHKAFEAMEQRLKEVGLPLEFEDIGSAASVGLYSFKADVNEVDAIVSHILKEVLKEIESFATLVWSSRPVNKDESFMEAVNHLLAECRWKQYQEASVILPQEKDRNQVCALNGLLPAVVQDQVGGERKVLSKSVNIRRDRGRNLRNLIYKELLGESVPAPSDDPDEWIVTKDLEMLSKSGKAGKLDGKIAFIYLDGNRFGRIRDEKCRDANLYRQFQYKIRKELREPALKSLLEFARQPDHQSFLTDDKGKIRLETLLWGGDEIEWVVPAWQALNVLKLFFETTRANNSFQGVTLSHSAGVVFCNHNLPIMQIRRYARQLCDICKEDIPKEIHEIGPDADCFAFLSIVSFDYMARDIRQFLKDYYRPASEKDFVIKAESIGNFNQHLPTLKKYFPSNKLNDILETLGEGNYDEAKDISKRALSLLGDWQLKKVNDAVKTLIGDNLTRWFVAADLMRYAE